MRLEQPSLYEGKTMMNMQFASLSLALLGSLAMLTPSAAQAGNIGVFGSCNGSATSKDAVIAAAGHTRVTVNTLDAASLAGLNALILESCNTPTFNSDLTSAVSNGMTLIVADWHLDAASPFTLPGGTSVSITYSPKNFANLAAGFPYATGPGGTLTNTSLDGGNNTFHAYLTAPLPAGFTALLVDDTDASNVPAFTYNYGNGKVIYNFVPFDYYLGQNQVITPGITTYVTNLLALGEIVAPTTCASEGYTGAKLIWCQNICENGLTGRTLDTWIHRWIRQYRDLPYCAVEEEEEEQQEG